MVFICFAVYVLANNHILIVVYGRQATIHDSQYGTTRALFAKYIHGKTDENHVLFSKYLTQ